jgi:hypothetical protein
MLRVAQGRRPGAGDGPGPLAGDRRYWPALVRVTRATRRAARAALRRRLGPPRALPVPPSEVTRSRPAGARSLGREPGKDRPPPPPPPPPPSGNRGRGQGPVPVTPLPVAAARAATRSGSTGIECGGQAPGQGVRAPWK